MQNVIKLHDGRTVDVEAIELVSIITGDEESPGFSITLRDSSELRIRGPRSEVINDYNAVAAAIGVRGKLPS